MNPIKFVKVTETLIGIVKGKIYRALNSVTRDGYVLIFDEHGVRRRLVIGETCEASEPSPDHYVEEVVETSEKSPRRKTTTKIVTKVVTTKTSAAKNVLVEPPPRKAKAASAATKSKLIAKYFAAEEAVQAAHDNVRKASAARSSAVLALRNVLPTGRFMFRGHKHSISHKGDTWFIKVVDSSGFEEIGD